MATSRRPSFKVVAGRRVSVHTGLGGVTVQPLGSPYPTDRVQRDTNPWPIFLEHFRRRCRFSSLPIDYFMRAAMDNDLEKTMALWNGFDAAPARKNGIDSAPVPPRRALGLSGVRLALRQGHNGAKTQPQANAGHTHRFEPITVRAAARVLQLQRAGVVSAAESRFYLRELAAMDRHAGSGAGPALRRMARRFASSRVLVRDGGAPGPARGRRAGGRALETGWDLAA
jgi:hypothetical protein